MLVSANLLNKVVTEVACGSHHSMALTSTGEVSVVREGGGGILSLCAQHLTLEADSSVWPVKACQEHIECVWKELVHVDWATAQAN